MHLPAQNLPMTCMPDMLHLLPRLRLQHRLHLFTPMHMQRAFAPCMPELLHARPNARTRHVPMHAAYLDNTQQFEHAHTYPAPMPGLLLHPCRKVEESELCVWKATRQVRRQVHKPSDIL